MSKNKPEIILSTDKDKGKFFVNYRANKHPGLTIGYDKDGNWINRPITHHKHSDHAKLKKNPNPKDTRTSYIKISPRVDKKTKRGRHLKGFILDKKDEKWTILKKTK